MERQKSTESIEKLIVSRHHLAPIESLMIGSSIIKVGANRPINVLDLVDAARNEDAKSYSELFTPLALIEHATKLEEVVMARKTDKTLKGLMPIFDFEKQFALSQTGYRPMIQLSEIEEKSGLVWPIWEVLIVGLDDKVVPDSKLRAQLDIDENYREVFDFQKTAEDAKMRIVFKM